MILTAKFHSLHDRSRSRKFWKGRKSEILERSESDILPPTPQAWLKQGSRTQSVLCQRTSHLQKHQAKRMSRRIAVEQRRYAAGMADTQGLQQGSQTKIAPRAK